MTATIKLGVMPPMTGLVGIYGREIANAARIACDEINEAGGVLGRPLELVIEDDGSLPDSAVVAAEKLVSEHRCVAIIGNLLSNSRIAVAYRVAEPHKIPYLNFSFYEGSILSRYFFHFAALPNQQIDRMIPYMLEKFGPRMFFAGNNYEWPRGSVDAAKRALLQAGGQILGEEYTAIGVAISDIDRLLDKVEAAEPDVFVPYFAGLDQVNLLTRFTERGMKSRMAVVMGHYDELMASKLPAAVREGFYSSNTYFMTLDTPENKNYLARLARLPDITGIWPEGNGILTNFGEGTYLCVKAFAQAANAANSVESEALINALSAIRVTGPQGTVQMEPTIQHAAVNTYLSRCNAEGAFEIMETFGALSPVMPDRYSHQRVDYRATLEEDIRLQARLLEQMSETVMLVDTANGTIVYANGGAYRMFAYERGQLIGMPVAKLNSPHAGDPVQLAVEITDIITRTGSWKGELQNIRRDGTELWSAATVTAFTHPFFGEVWMSVYQDITASKQAETALLAAKLAAEAANRTKSEFLANMSHEIRTPMNSILGLTQLVLDSELTPQQENYLKKVVTSSRSLLSIINDILDYSKIESGHMKIERIPLRVEELLRDVADLFSARLEEKGLELFFDIGPEVPIEVLGDPLRLTQVLNNLVGNATKFTEHGEIHIKVSSEQTEENLTLSFIVRDTGIGFDEHLAESLFQPFIQADTSVTRKFGGTGLGLSICQKLVTLMGGDICAIGAAGKGATFSFSIRAGHSPTATRAQDLQQLTGLRVLVVDDQETSRLILQKLLEAWRLEVQTAASGTEALARIEEASRKKRPYDVVLLDWRMPGMSGLEVARQIEQKTSQGAAPMLTVMVTMHDRNSLLAEAGSIRLDGVLTKPMVPSDLFDILVNRRNLPVYKLTTESAASTMPVRFDGARILLVEDNLINQEVASAFLERRGAAVTLANNGIEALERVQGHTFDAVLMDLHMPHMDGIEATRRILALPENQNLPIIAMTAAVFEEDRERCTAAGMVDFVAKPVSPEALSLCLQKWLQAYVQRTVEHTTARVAPELPKLPGFDLPAALHRLDGDLPKLTRLLHGFAEERRDALSQLDALLQTRSSGEATDLLHALRGAAGNLGATDLAVAARQLEQEIRAGEAPHSRTAFASALETALTAIASTFPESISKTGTPSEIDLPALAELLGAFVPYLQEGELLPEELMQSLRQFALHDLPNKPLTKLIRKVDHFDHEGALSAIMQLNTTMNLKITP